MTVYEQLILKFERTDTAEIEIPETAIPATPSISAPPLQQCKGRDGIELARDFYRVFGGVIESISDPAGREIYRKK